MSGDQYRNYQDDSAAKAQDTSYTTSNGIPMPHPYEAQRAGESGPLLLQDFHLIVILSHFDRERIPKRVVHAKGSGGEEKVFDTKAKERFIGNISSNMANCKEEDIIKPQIRIFREVSEDLASKLEKGTGVKGYPGIADLKFNSTHNGMASNTTNRTANDTKGVQLGRSENNGAPLKG